MDNLIAFKSEEDLINWIASGQPIKYGEVIYKLDKYKLYKHSSSISALNFSDAHYFYSGVTEQRYKEFNNLIVSYDKTSVQGLLVDENGKDVGGRIVRDGYRVIYRDTEKVKLPVDSYNNIVWDKLELVETLIKD